VSLRFPIHVKPQQHIKLGPKKRLEVVGSNGSEWDASQRAQGIAKE